jgi:uncharacterized protein (DUF2164 family)
MTENTSRLLKNARKYFKEQLDREEDRLNAYIKFVDFVAKKYPHVLDEFNGLV